jgi:hypothetical protein
MMDLTERVTAVQTARRADVAESGSESNNLNFGLCEVVYEWAKGRVRTSTIHSYFISLMSTTLPAI